jgi:hypothetical protein
MRKLDEGDYDATVLAKVSGYLEGLCALWREVHSSTTRDGIRGYEGIEGGILFKIT